LLVLLGIASILGTVIIQENTSEAQHIDQVYSKTVIKVFSRLGFFDIYHSGIYIGVLVFLAANLLACVYKRLKRDAVRKTKYRKSRSIDLMKKLPNTRELTMKHRDFDLAGVIESAGKFQGLKLSELEPGSWYGEKYRSAEWGYYILHFGFLIILMGGLVSSVMGIEGMIWLIPGEKTSSFRTFSNETIPLGFTLECKEFSIDRYESGQVSEFRSELAVEDNGTELLHHTLLVNSPMAFGGFRFFQSSYQIQGAGEVSLKLDATGEPSSFFSISVPGEKQVELQSGEKYTIKVLEFVPDFIFDQDGRVASRSGNLNNPAVSIQVLGSDDVAGDSRWCFQNFPDFKHDDSDDSLRINLVDSKPLYATGLQVAQDPGSDIIWVGSILLILGIFLSFFFKTQRIWVRVQDNPDNSKTIFIAGNLTKTNVQDKSTLIDLMIDYIKLAG